MEINNMPYYTWKSGDREIDVFREFDDYLVPPKVEEVRLSTGLGAEDAAELEWVKIIGPTKVTKAPTWGPGKGRW
jgi:hypothetical protein